MVTGCHIVIKLARVKRALKAKPLIHTMGSEFEEQAAIVKWARFWEIKYPELKLLNASANGVRLTKAQAGKAKAAGMVAGWPDLNLPVARGGFNGLYIELKVGRRKPEAHQVAILKALAAQGHCCRATWGRQKTIETLIDYLEGRITKEDFMDNSRNLIETIDNAARDLPSGYIINLGMENGAAWVELLRPDSTREYGLAETIDGVDRTLAEQIKDALDIAIEAAKKGGV